MMLGSVWPAFNIYLPKLKGFAVYRGMLEWMGAGILNTCRAVVMYVWHILALDNNKNKFGNISVSYDYS